jgi:uncharacterized membrane protein
MAAEEKQTGRLEAFSDGVFAIAMTLLALELKVPHPAERTSAALASALAHEWPSYFAFITSFFTVLIMWVHHHVIFRLVHRTDATLLFANGFLLLLVTVVPFRKAVLDESANEERIRRLRRDYRMGPPAYLAAAVAAPFSPWLAMAICTALWIFWALTTQDC